MNKQLIFLYLIIIFLFVYLVARDFYKQDSFEYIRNIILQKSKRDKFIGKAKKRYYSELKNFKKKMEHYQKLYGRKALAMMLKNMRTDDLQTELKERRKYKLAEIEQNELMQSERRKQLEENDKIADMENINYKGMYISPRHANVLDAMNMESGIVPENNRSRLRMQPNRIIEDNMQQSQEGSIVQQ